jgi:CBS domain containing-hemolysin-like protein
MAGRIRTASRPSRTVILLALYSAALLAFSKFSSLIELSLSCAEYTPETVFLQENLQIFRFPVAVFRNCVYIIIKNNSKSTEESCLNLFHTAKKSNGN